MKKCLLLAFVICASIFNVGAMGNNHLSFKEVGQAKLSLLFWDVYHSRLLTPSGSYQVGDATFALEITYLRNISKAQLIESTIEQWQHLNINEGHYLPYLDTLNAIWPDVSKGDQLTFVVNPNESAFFFNGLMIGEIEQKEFGPLFSAIWLDKNTSRPKLRAKLIGGISGD